MTDNRVELIVDAKAAAATADIDVLKTKLNDIGRQVETAKVQLAGDKEAQAALARMNSQLVTLGRQVSKPKVTVEGVAKADADLLGVELRLDRLHEKAEEINDPLKKSAEALASVGSAAVGSGAAIANAAVETAGMAEALGPLGAGLAIVAVEAGLVAAVFAGPLIAGLGVVTLGFGAFAAAAIPEVSKVLKALTATGPAAKAAWKALSPDEKQLAKPLEGIKTQFSQLQKAIQPEIIRAFADALKILKDVMPALKPLAQAAGKALDAFLKDIDKWLQGSSGKKFLAWMETDGPKAIKTFGHAMTDLVNGVGIVMYWWDRLGDDLDKFVRTWAPRVGLGFGDMRTAFRQTVTAVGDVIHAWDNVMHAAGNVVHAIGNVVNAVQNAVSWFGRLAGAANSALGGIPGKIAGFLGLASGGIVGAASGGVHGGMRWVGEQGPELVRLPLGSTVYPAGQSKAMAAQSGGAGNSYSINVTVAPGGHPGETGRQIVQMIREFEKRSGSSWRN